MKFSSKLGRRSVIGVAATGVIAATIAMSPSAEAGTSSVWISTSYMTVNYASSSNSSTGRVTYGGTISDLACDSNGIEVHLDVYSTGGTNLATWWDSNNNGCRTIKSISHYLTPGQLKGNRSGYYEVTACKHSGVHNTGCRTNSNNWSS